ncbi:M20/M25/M40 family metallo-hydrolase [Ramlibacter humi]|uniref:M20/M25/M40 family metallo-hydrolase n=1 Tax=Ramlibacter humi TaxID=2530451 RepID=A0A4Z0C0X2_9BURK|nr:M20/M25/M40 family metallo-hydrolase [Ramlibacter humi]TFZ03889.1 M20/M25/M40 family metallo-hydrolase [Ramlibacter humi]
MKKLAITLSSLALAASAYAQQPVQNVWQAAASEQPKLLATLKSLVEIETGSTNRAGLDKLSTLIHDRLKAMGGQVEYIEPNDADVYRMEDTPEKASGIGRMVRATFKGTGTKKIMLMAHMDTVYPEGMAKDQPFRVDGNKAYGLGIADDKQGVAVILHAVALLQQLNIKDYGTLTVFINGDEEISSPASRKLFAKMGAEHDAVMSFEGSRVDQDKLALATSGIALAAMTVRGRASHAGSAPERGVNALYELSHQLLQLRDLSVPERGLKVNWTVAKAGVVRNMIPPGAQAWADIRLIKVSDLASVEAKVQERIKKKLLPESVVEVKFENRRPPLEATDASRAMGALGQKIYKEIGKDLMVDPEPEGGGTDAAFAALETKSPVVERFGLQGFGAHSNNAEYVLVDSIQPRLYLATRMVQELSKAR